MGRQGIKRRKPRRELPDTDNVSEGDVDRLFGRFRWNEYSPAGNLERSGFFWRQFTRNGARGAGAFIADAKWAFAFVLAVCAVVALVVLVLSLLAP
jgi:hypothetical protein